MSCGLGIMCNNGIVLGCDSGIIMGLGLEMLRSEGRKWFDITDDIKLIGTGRCSSSDYLVELILEDMPLHVNEMSLREFRYFIEDCSIKLHERYNLTRSPISKNSEEPRFNILSLISYRNVDGALGLFEVHGDGFVEPVHQWQPVGSLGVVPEYLMQQFYHPDIEIKKMVRIVYYILSETINVDPYCGGRIRVGYLIPDRPFVDLQENELMEISKVVQERRALLHNQVYKKMFDEEFNLK